MLRPLTSVFLIITTISIAICGENNDFSIKDLKPEPQHQRVVQKVTQILSQLHYKDVVIDDSLSKKLYTNYIDYLDYNKSYFIANDLKSFERYKYNFDQYLLSGNLEPIYFIFNQYQKRAKTRLEFVDRQIDEPFDFTIDEFYEPYRDSIEWAQTMNELDEYWRKRIKNEYLSLKISGKEDDKIKETLHKRYNNFKRRVSQNQSEDVVQVYLNALGSIFDPHTNYFSPKAKEDFQIRMQQSLEGIGARLTTLNEYTRIDEVISGGPADKSNLLKKDDLIISVGQNFEEELVDVIGWRLDDVVQLIRGPKGTVVRLQILHDENDLISDAETVILTRDKIKLEDSAAKSDTLHFENNGEKYILGIITIPSFYLNHRAMQEGDPDYQSTTRDVEKILSQFKSQNVDGIIIDLRRNGGGFLSEAIDLTGLFITEGPVVQVRNVKGKVKIGKDYDPKVSYNGPLAVLVDEFSASASEIFAAAIQDYGRGIIIGNQTYGKGTVQQVYDLNRFFPHSSQQYGQVKLTIQKFYRINGGSTQHLGVIPDIELPSPFEHDDVGESSQENALLWDQINSARYNKTENDLNGMISSLKNNYLFRKESDDVFIEYLAEIENSKKRRNKKSFSLNEEKRLAEKENKKKDKEDKEKKDFILVESSNILSDYIHILKSR